MRIVYLDAWAIGDTDLSPLEQLGDLTTYRETPSELVSQRIAEAEIVITNKVRIGAEQLARAERCRLVVASATGMDHIDREACAERGIATTNVAGYATESVAQYTIGAALVLRQRLRQRDRYVRSGTYTTAGRWTHPQPAWAALAGAWGIVGLGAIGRRVGELARAFGCTTYFYSASGPRSESGFEQLELDELLERCAVVSVHAPGVPRYRGLLGSAELAKLRPSALLLSVGRGGIVDERSVARALLDERLGGAAFDVFADEPPAADNPLLDPELRNRILLTPHMAWTSQQALNFLIAGLAERIRALDA